MHVCGFNLLIHLLINILTYQFLSHFIDAI